MANRVKDVLRFITVWHPERYLQCKVSDLKSKRHLIRPRAVSNKRREIGEKKHGFKRQQQAMDDGTVRVGQGTPVRSYCDTSISGQQLLPFVSGVPRLEPVLIYVPDEIQGKAKWRCELRTLADWKIQLQDPYPDGFESLPRTIGLEVDDSSLFWKSLLESDLRIRGFWLNPSHNAEIVKKRTINIVVGPIGGHKLRAADLQMIANEKHFWIEYTEQINE